MTGTCIYLFSALPGLIQNVSVVIRFGYIHQKTWNFSSLSFVLLPGKSHGQRSLVGCNPWGHEESDMTEQLLFHFSLSCIGEGDGNPLLCSRLENPRDGGAWWAAVYGVAQSWTRLKWLSSSSRSTIVSPSHLCFYTCRFNQLQTM